MTERLSTEGLMKHYTENPWTDNYMIAAGKFLELCEIYKWTPNLDICCDLLGTNSLCQLFYSARENSLQQTLGNYKILCNPPYQERMLDKFTRKLERTMLLYPDTRVLLMLPYKPKDHYYRKFMARNRWKVRAFIPVGHGLF